MPNTYEPITDKKFLDADGVTYYTRFINDTLSAVVDGVQDALDEKVDSDIYTNEYQGQGYGVCNTAAATAAKAVSLPSYRLMQGGVISVRFVHDVPANATMSVNECTAAPMYYRGDAIQADVIIAGDIATFMYDGDKYSLLTVDRTVAIPSITDAQIDGLFAGEPQNISNV